MDYLVIYDIRQDFGPWWFPVIGCVIASMAFIMLFALRNRQMPPRLGQTKNQAMVLAAVIAFLSLAASASSAVFLYSQERYYRTIFESGKALVVEGFVENYKPMSADRGSSNGVFESFTVDGIPFQYSDYIIKPGFRNSALLGGPIRTGLKVRIYYYESVILRLEIASRKQS